MNNTVFDKVKSTMNTAAGTISTVAQSFIEKNRIKAKLNRLRMVMKSESELMNRAYIALGKEYYESLKKDGSAPANENQKNLLEVIDNSKAKIAKARDCYRKILESQNDYLYAAPVSTEEYSHEEIVDITVACSNEDDYDTSPFAAEEAPIEVKSEVAPEAEAEEADIETDEHISEAIKEALDEEHPDEELF